MSAGSPPSLPFRAARGLRRGWNRLRRGFLRTDGFALLLLVAAALGVGWLSTESARWFSPASLAVVVLVAGFVLSVRSLVLLLAVVAGVMLWEANRLGETFPGPGSVLVVAVTAVVVIVVARSRARVGVQGLRGESMLVDLRDRLKAQGELPVLPTDWQAEVVLRPAGGASFSGDFLVASASPGGRVLEVVVVDVSGKGVDAGTRALLLSGAFGGLLGAMPPEEFLDAANAYLIRQGWDEGFATAVHLTLDLEDGQYYLASAGHPPAAQYAAGSGTWRLTDAHGTALGIDPNAVFEGERGRLAPGDAMLLYTDGLVERPGLDISVGIDALLGQAERLVPKGFRRGARKLVDAVRTGEGDDRALVLIWRR
jgi:hypothetical protein